MPPAPARRRPSPATRCNITQGVAARRQAAECRPRADGMYRKMPGRLIACRRRAAEEPAPSPRATGQRLNKTPRRCRYARAANENCWWPRQMVSPALPSAELRWGTWPSRACCAAVAPEPSARARPAVGAAGTRRAPTAISGAGGGRHGVHAHPPSPLDGKHVAFQPVEAGKPAELAGQELAPGRARLSTQAMPKATAASSYRQR